MRADMPDAAASRKRQIQITPRPFRGAGAFRIRLTNGRYPLLRVWARLSGLGGPEGSRLVQRLAWRARRGIWPMGEVCPAHRCGNRVKLIRGRRRADSIPSPPQGSKPSRASARVCLTLWMPFGPGNRVPITFRRFFAPLGRSGGGEASPRPAPTCDAPRELTL